MGPGPTGPVVAIGLNMPVIDAGGLFGSGAPPPLGITFVSVKDPSIWTVTSAWPLQPVEQRWKAALISTPVVPS